MSSLMQHRDSNPKPERPRRRAPFAVIAIAILALVGVSVPAAAFAADESSTPGATAAPLDVSSQEGAQATDAAEPDASGIGDPTPIGSVGSPPEQVSPSPSTVDDVVAEAAPAPLQTGGNAGTATPSTPPATTSTGNSAPSGTPATDNKGDKGDKDDKGDSWHSTPLTLDLEANCCDDWDADGTTLTVTAGGLAAQKSYVVTVLTSGTIIDTWRIESPKSASIDKVFVVPGAGSYEVRLVPARSTKTGGAGADDSMSSGTRGVKGTQGGTEKGISECIEIPPCPEESVPSWSLSKAANPVSGSVVSPGQDVTYTLTAQNTSDVVITDAQATDDLSGVIPEHATLVEPLASGLSLAGTSLTWMLPTLNPGGATVSVSYVVTVNADQFGQAFDNIVTPGPNGECISDTDEIAGGMPEGEPEEEPAGDGCTTHHSVINIDLALLKTASTPDGEAVDSGEGDLITHTLAITNSGDDPSWRTSIVDTLPLGLTADPSTVVFIPADPDQHWSVSVDGGVLTAQHDGWFQPGQVQSVSFASTVGDLTRESDEQPYPDLVNNACVAGEQYPDSDVSGLGFDSNPDNNCDTATTPVKALAVAAAPRCVKDAPSVQFTVTPFNIADPATQPIALIWWTPAAYADRDPSISAGDAAAILANGASRVDAIAYPDGWTSGTPISGEELWPGAAVNASGAGIAWPGWTQLANGQWIIDPTAPFYDLRNEAVVELRVNPSTATTIAYPSETRGCSPTQPTPATTPGTAPGTTPGTTSGTTPTGGTTRVAALASAGFTGSGLLPLGGGLALLGLVLMMGAARRRGNSTNEG